MNEDFRCPFCKEETDECQEDILSHNVKFENLTDKKINYCKKHKFLLYEKEYYGGGLFRPQSSRWVFLRKLKPTDFVCGSCIHWNFKKSVEDEDGIRKTCEFGLQKGREYEDMNFCSSCEKFKWRA